MIEGDMMQVRKDGQVQWRLIDYVEAVEIGSPHPSRVVPRLNEGEELHWVLGDDIPHIVQDQIRSPLFDLTLDKPFPLDPDFN